MKTKDDRRYCDKAVYYENGLINMKSIAPKAISPREKYIIIVRIKWKAIESSIIGYLLAFSIYFCFHLNIDPTNGFSKFFFLCFEEKFNIQCK